MGDTLRLLCCEDVPGAAKDKPPGDVGDVAVAVVDEGALSAVPLLFFTTLSSRSVNASLRVSELATGEVEADAFEPVLVVERNGIVALRGGTFIPKVLTTSFCGVPGGDTNLNGAVLLVTMLALGHSA